jgi:hypothetical protein
MATRSTKLIIKNNSVPNAPFSGATLLKGEAIVNTADGIMMFSGVTSSTSEWTPAGTGGDSTFFEVGSNLYDLRLRNRITKYEGQTGSGLVGKFLSGTTNGFVLADISDIADATDSYVTGATWNPNQLTLNLNQNKPSVSVNIDAFTALTINGDLFVTDEITTNNLTITGTGIYDTVANGSNNNEIVNWSSLTAHTSTTDRYVTGGTYDNNSALITFSGANNFPTFTVDLSSIDVNDTYVTGGTNNAATNNTNSATIDLLYNQDIVPNTYSLPYVDSFTTGGTYDNNTFLITFDKNDGSNFTVDLSSIDVNDTFLTGGTVSYDSNELNGTLMLTRNDGNTVTITGFTDVQTTGATLVGNTVFFDTNESLSAYTLDLSALDVNDTFVTGFTYNSSTNTITLSQNESQPNLNVTINSVSGLTIDNLTSGRVVYVGTNGELTDEVGFEYNDVTDLLTVGNIFVNNPSGTTANIGQGGLVIGSGGSTSASGIGDLVVHGDLTVFGDTTTISTSELYIEDPQIELNYNPTGDTSVSSIGSGILIQDGGGVAGQDAKIGIGQLFGSSISGDTSEYSSTTGFENRGWVTQLNDIVIRNSSPVNFGDPDGVRVLAEGDILDGGIY